MLTNEQLTELAEPFWLKDAQKEGEFFDVNGFARALLAAAKPVSEKYIARTPEQVEQVLDMIDAETNHAKPVSDSVPLEITPNTLGGFRGAFYVANNRAPTEQEVFDAGIKSGMSRIPKPVSVDAGGMTRASVLGEALRIVENAQTITQARKDMRKARDAARATPSTESTGEPKL